MPPVLKFQTVKFPSAQLCIYSGYVIKRPEITESGRLGEKVVDSGVKFSLNEF